MKQKDKDEEREREKEREREVGRVGKADILVLLDIYSTFTAKSLDRKSIIGFH